MRRALPAALTTLLLAMPAAAGASPPAGFAPDVPGARAYAESRAGDVSFSVRTERGARGHRSDVAFPSASAVKAMLLVAYLRAPEVRLRALTPDDRNLLTPMIRWSSNRDATAVFERLGVLALPELARRAGMRRFTGGTFWSASRITAGDQTRLFLAIDRLVPARHRAYAMGLLGRIVPRHRWGVAHVAPPGWKLYFKSGWTRAVEHQAALLVRGRRRVSVAVLTSGSPSPAYARSTQAGLFRRLLRGL
jgi:hypothetical protein